MAERKHLQTGAQRQVPRNDRVARAQNKVHQSTGGTTIGVNKHAVTDLSLYGPQNRAEALLREVHRTLKRIGLRTDRGIKPFSSASKGNGASANIHDLIRWLDSLDSRHGDIDFLKQLYKTLCGRVSKGFLKDLGKDPHAKPAETRTRLGG